MLMTEQRDDDAKPPGRAYNRIDENLRRVYQDVEKEPVPDRLQKLIEQLRQQDGKS